MDEHPFNSNDHPASSAVASSERLPLPVVLDALATDVGDPRLDRAVERIKASLAKGLSLDEALAGVEKTAPGYLIAMLRAATTSDELATVCDSFARLRDSSDRAWRTLRGLVFYPLAMLLALTGVALLLGYVMMPQFEDIFTEFELELPMMTEGALALGHVLPWVLIAITLAWVLLTVAPGLIGIGYPLRNALPLVGKLFSSISHEQWSATLANFVAMRMPLAGALRYTGDLVDDRQLARETHRIAKLVEQGTSPAEAMAGSRAFDRSLTALVKWGVDRSRLESTLGMAAELYADRRQQRLVLLRRIVPPLVLVAVASTTVVLAASLFLPLVKLVEGLS
ncbi:type II secretion system F family protein [Aeoliella sp. SH292]|uniref:type II secretion system F family protein n=1 Tax=Aeoliella sp. SH292 TaxID=3454464 RepID=UPI003F9637E5